MAKEELTTTSTTHDQVRAGRLIDPRLIDPPLFDFITPRLATGAAIWDKRDVAALRRAGITHVATLALELEGRTRSLLRRTDIRYLLNGTEDDGRAKGTRFFEATIDFALTALRDPGAKVLVHCGAGINRGPSGAYAILRALGYSADEALHAIVAVRPVAEVLYRADADAAVIALGYADPLDRRTPA